MSRAFSRAQTLRAQYPTSSKLAVYWVISSPPEITLEKIEQELPKDVSSDPDVALALSRKALAEMTLPGRLHMRSSQLARYQKTPRRTY